MIRGKERFLSKLYMVVDFVFIQIAFQIAWIARFYIENDIVEGSYLSYSVYFIWNIVYSIIYIFGSFLLQQYTPKRKKKFASEVFKIIQVHVLSMFILLSIFFIMKVMDISRLFLVYYLLICIFLSILYRFFVKQILRKVRSKGYNRQFVIVLGAGNIGKSYVRNLTSHPEFGLHVLGFLDDYKKQNNNLDGHNSTKIIGKLQDLERILSEKIIDEVVIALPISAYPKYKNIISICEKAGVRVSIVTDFHDILPANPHFEQFGDLQIINARDIPLDEYVNKVIKRTFDIVFSLIAIIITSPLLLCIAIGIKLTSPGPILFKQERVGLNRRTFMMYKFRSMKSMPEESSNTQWTIENDPRRTKIGTFLRKTSLDELPQFFNVLKGDMSVVGPRPERPFFVDLFKEEIPKYMVKHQVRPGITGWAQVCGLRGDTSIKDRIDHDIFYLENWTILFDLKIILKTIINGFVNKNAY